jgi:phage/plasmid-like protein (TIGR03299 family)
MSHEITEKDTFGETANGGNRAWHGLGIEIESGLTAVEGFKKIGLGWETKLIPLVVTDPELGEISDPDFFIHARVDTKESLGVVSKDYKVLSNQFLAEFADSLVGADATVRLETAGSLRRGKRVFACIKLPKTIEVVKDDIVNMYVVISNAHDGSAGFNVYGSSTRVVCANTLRMSERELYRGSSFAHTGNIEVKVERARQALGIVIKQGELFEKEVRALAKLRLTKEQIGNYFSAVYTRMFGEITSDLESSEQERRLNHKMTTIGYWNASMEKETQNIKGIESTAWAAYNAFSEWSDHERGRFGDIKSSESRVHSNFFGVSALDKRKAFRTALEAVKV